MVVSSSCMGQNFQNWNPTLGEGWGFQTSPCKLSTSQTAVKGQILVYVLKMLFLAEIGGNSLDYSFNLNYFLDLLHHYCI